MSAPPSRNTLINIALNYATLVTPEKDARLLEEIFFPVHQHTLASTLILEKKKITKLAKRRGYDPKILLYPIDPLDPIESFYPLKAARLYFLYENVVLKKEHSDHLLNQSADYQTTEFRYRNAKELKSNINSNEQLSALFVSAMVKDRLTGIQREEIFFPDIEEKNASEKTVEQTPITALNHIIHDKSHEILSEYTAALAKHFMNNSISLLGLDAMQDCRKLSSTASFKNALERQRIVYNKRQSWQKPDNNNAYALAPRKDDLSNN